MKKFVIAFKDEYFDTPIVSTLLTQRKDIANVVQNLSRLMNIPASTFSVIEVENKKSKNIKQTKFIISTINSFNQIEICGVFSAKKSAFDKVKKLSQLTGKPIKDFFVHKVKENVVEVY